MAHAADGVGVSKYNRLQQYALDMVTAITKLKAFMADYSRHRRRPPPHAVTIARTSKDRQHKPKLKRESS